MILPDHPKSGFGSKADIPLTNVRFTSKSGHRDLLYGEESRPGTDYKGKSSVPFAGRLLAAGVAPVAAVALPPGGAFVVAEPSPLASGGIVARLPTAESAPVSAAPLGATGVEAGGLAAEGAAISTGPLALEGAAVSVTSVVPLFGEGEPVSLAIEDAGTFAGEDSPVSAGPLAAEGSSASDES